jgi:hypothetical protein
MKISLLKNLINAQNNCKEEEIDRDYSEVPTIKYEQLDQLRCYIDLAIIFEDEYNQLLNNGKEDFLTNYELVNDFIPSTIHICKSYINIGLDLNEFLQNSLIIKSIIKDDEVLEEDLNTLFKFVCTNNKEIKDKFITLLLFFELCDKKNNIINVSKFKYACSLFEMTLNNN